jgi:hypothetical protein
MHRISIAADGRKSLLAMLKPRHDGFFKYRSLFTGSVDSVDEGTVLLYVEHHFPLSPSAAENCAGTVEHNPAPGYNFEGVLLKIAVAGMSFSYPANFSH